MTMNKPMKPKLFTLLAVVAIAFGTPACENLKNVFPFVSPATNVQASTYTVQGAEKGLKQAKLTSDLFFGLVKDNHAFVVAHLPAIYTFAQDMQVKVPDILRKANKAKNVFKDNRTADNQTTLNGLMITLTQIQNDVLAKTTELKKATGTP